MPSGRANGASPVAAAGSGAEAGLGLGLGLDMAGAGRRYQQDFQPPPQSQQQRSSPAATSSSSGGGGGGAPKPIRRRMRMITSCLECRRRKLKCNKSNPCTNCLKFSRDCLYLGPKLDEASQLRLTEIKEKVGSLERQLERDVAKSGGGGGGAAAGAARHGGGGFFPQRILADDVEGEFDEERDLEITPMVALDLTYEEDADGPDDIMDLGVQVGKMRLTEKIGGLNRPRISEEVRVATSSPQRAPRQIARVTQRADTHNRYRLDYPGARRSPVASPQAQRRPVSASGRRASRGPVPTQPGLTSRCPTSSGPVLLTYHPPAASSSDRSSSRRRCSPSCPPSQQVTACSGTTSTPCIPLRDACTDRPLRPSTRAFGRRLRRAMNRARQYRLWFLRRGLVPPWQWTKLSSIGSLASPRRTWSRI